MSEQVNLNLLIFGTIRTFPCSADFKLEQLEDYLTISDCISHEKEIFAKVALVKRPFSQFERDIPLAKS